LRCGERTDASGRDGEVTLRAPAARGRRLALARRDEPLGLETIERRVRRACGHGTSQPVADLPQDRAPVTIAAEPHDRNQDGRLEEAESVSHIYIVDIIAQRATRNGAAVGTGVSG